MKRAGWWQALAIPVVLLLAVPAGAAPQPADKAALAQVSAASPVVVYLHGVEGTAARLVAYLKNAVPKQAPIIEGAIKNYLEAGFDDRKLKGLQKEGPIFLAFSEIPQNEEPKLAVIVAVTNYAEFRDGLLKEDERKALKANAKTDVEETKIDGKSVYFLDRKGYAVVTTDKKTADAYAQKMVGLDTKISKAQATQLLAGDVGLYVNLDVVNKDYAEQIKTAKEELEAALKNAEQGLAKNQRGAFEAARNLLNPVFQAVEDSKGVVATIEFRPTAIVMHLESELKANTKTAASLKSYKPLALAELDRLPSGQVFYTGLMTNADLLKLLGPLMVGVVSESDKALKGAVADLAKCGPGSRIDFSGLPASGVQTWQFAQPAKALVVQTTILDSLVKGDTFGGGMLKQKAALKKNSAKFKNIEFHSLTLAWDLEKMAEASGMELPEDVQKKMVEGFKRILGEQSTVWFGADDKHLITVTAADWKTAQTLLEKHFTGADAVGKQKGYQEARKELADGAVVVTLIDVVGYGTAIAEIMKPILGGLGINFPDKYPAKLPPGDPSFLAMAVTVNESRLGFDFVITASAVRDIYRAFILPFQGGF